MDHPERKPLRIDPRPSCIPVFVVATFLLACGGNADPTPRSEAGPDTTASVVQVDHQSSLAAKVAALDAGGPFVEREVVERYAALLESGSEACAVSEPLLASMISRRVQSIEIERGVRVTALELLQAVDSSPNVETRPGEGCGGRLDQIADGIATRRGGGEESP